MRFSVLLLLLFLISNHSAQSQGNFRSGYIITVEDDTVRGVLRFRTGKSNHYSCTFKKDSQEKTYGPVEIHGFGFDGGQHFSSVYTNTAFLEVLIVGEMQLLRMDDIFYLRKRGQDMVTVKSEMEETIVNGRKYERESGAWKNICYTLMGDCIPDLPKRLQTLRLTEKTMVSLVTDFNQCGKAAVVDVKGTRRWSKVSPGISAGIIMSTITIAHSDNFKDYLPSRYEATSFTVGVPFEISSPRSRQRFSIQPELYFSKINFSANTVVDNQPVQSRYYKSTINLTTLSTPLSLKIPLIDRGLTVYTNLGMNMDWQLSAKSRVDGEIHRNGDVEVLPAEDFVEPVKIQFGGLAGVGVSRKVGRIKLGLNLRYSYMSQLNGTQDYIARPSRIYILLYASKI